MTHHVLPLRAALLCATLATCLATTPAGAFDLGNLKDLERVKKAVEIGGKVAKANREINQDEEIEIGKGVAAQVLGAAPLVDNKPLQDYVNRVGLWLAMQTERADLPWRFGVVASDDVNAFSMPGGTVLLTRGLYSRLRNEGELAAVLAHEIGHVLEKHQLRQIQKQLGNEWKMDLVNAVAEDKGTRGAQNFAKAFSAGTEVFTRGLDKQDEFAADRAGVVIAARAGYNPYGLVSVLQTLDATSAQDSAVALMFKTHPAPATRLDLLDQSMGDSLEPWAGGVEKTRRFIPLKAVAASDAAREAATKK